MKLLESVQTADVKPAAELAPLTRDFLARFAPQDPAERMPAAQIVATFGRAMFLAPTPPPPTAAAVPSKRPAAARRNSAPRPSGPHPAGPPTGPAPGC
jgi:hypothetical protein